MFPTSPINRTPHTQQQFPPFFSFDASTVGRTAIESPCVGRMESAACSSALLETMR